MLIDLTDAQQNNNTFVESLCLEFLSVSPTGTCVDNRSQAEGSINYKVGKILTMINLIFDAMILMIMFLCFFALSANMSANLYD